MSEFCKYVNLYIPNTLIQIMYLINLTKIKLYFIKKI